METPLDVLSRAASIVDVRDSMRMCNTATGMKRSLDPIEIQPRDEIPSKFYKYQRMSATETETMRHALINDKKCAGTQTAVSNIHHAGKDSPPYHPNGMQHINHYHSRPNNRASPKHLLDLDQHNKLNTYTPSYASPVPARFLDLLPTQEANDQDSMPLNLSVSASNGVSSAAQSAVNGFENYRLRHHAATPSENVAEGGRQGENKGYSSSHSSKSSHRASSYEAQQTENGSKVGLCDSVIEEHFQRSLGKNYTSGSNAASVSTTSQQQPPAPKLVVLSTPVTSAAGSVDDHFAKSLGETWTKIKEQKDPSNSDGMWSVDDHFAKALGDQWFRIKHAKENGSAVNNLPAGSQRRHINI